MEMQHMIRVDVLSESAQKGQLNNAIGADGAGVYAGQVCVYG
jgi:hypothetical protein